VTTKLEKKSAEQLIACQEHLQVEEKEQNNTLFVKRRQQIEISMQSAWNTTPKGLR